MSDDLKLQSIPSAVPAFRPEMAFPYFTDEMVVRLQRYGRAETFASGATLYARGEREVDMFVILDGVVEVFAQSENEERKLIATLGQRQFTGELDLLSSRQTLVNAYTASDCNLLRVPRSEFQRLMRFEGDIANLIMQATIWRRLGIIEGSMAAIVVLGHSTAAETIQLQRFLTRNGYPHRLLEPTAEQFSRAEAGDSSAEGDRLPAIIFADGRVLPRPSIADLANDLGFAEQFDPEKTYDLAVVGAGPSGLAAAVYGASEGLSTLVIEGFAPGGQAGTTTKIENYLGFPTGVSGQELANRAHAQALKFGARLAIARDVTAIDPVDGRLRLTVAGGATVNSRAIVIATGAKYRKLAVENYDRFEDQGIEYAATAIEATLCRDDEVAVVGGGNSAGQAAVFLSAIARHVFLIVRGESLVNTMSSYLISRIENSASITLLCNTEVEQLEGEFALQFVTWVSRKTGVHNRRRIGTMFVMIGAEPCSGWLYGTLALDKKGFIITGNPQGFENTRYATSVPGIYAVGDVRSDSVKRVASAVGEGSVVIADIHRYLAAHCSVAAEAGSTLAALQAVGAPPA